ncbi:hypothetical protein BH23ACT11_BH23ACT11_01640 [soil metagenome]
MKYAMGGAQLRTFTAACLAPLFAAVTIAGCGSARPDRAEITTFDPASGTYRPGDEVDSSLHLRNTSREKRTFWIGYSVQDEGGAWHDAPSSPIQLAAGESVRESQSWKVPENPPTAVRRLQSSDGRLERTPQK